MAKDHAESDDTSAASLTSTVRLLLINAGLTAANADGAIEQVHRVTRGIPDEHSSVRYTFIRRFSDDLARKRLGSWAKAKNVATLSFQFQALFLMLTFGGVGGRFEEVLIKLRTIPEEHSSVRQTFIQAVCDEQARRYLGEDAKNPESLKNFSTEYQIIFFSLTAGAVGSLFGNKLEHAWDAGVQATKDFLKSKQSNGGNTFGGHPNGSHHSATGHAHKPFGSDPRSGSLAGKSKPHSNRGVHHKGSRHHSSPNAQQRRSGSHDCDLPPVDHGGAHSGVAEAHASAMSERVLYHTVHQASAAAGRHSAKVVHQAASNHAEGIASYVLAGIYHFIRALFAGWVASD